MQSQQADDNRAFSREQKDDEKYHTRKRLLTDRKDDINRNIRDLGVLPEEAFEKYIGWKLERVPILLESSRLKLTRLPNIVGQEAAQG